MTTVLKSIEAMSYWYGYSLLYFTSRPIFGKFNDTSYSNFDSSNQSLSFYDCYLVKLLVYLLQPLDSMQSSLCRATWLSDRLRRLQRSPHAMCAPGATMGWTLTGPGSHELNWDLRIFGGAPVHHLESVSSVSFGYHSVGLNLLQTSQRLPSVYRIFAHTSGINRGTACHNMS